MNRLPQHRQIINGRTYSQPWDPAGFDPFRRYRSPGHFASRILTVAIGAGLALVLVRWIDWSIGQ